jgi:hypothetical protein
MLENDLDYILKDMDYGCAIDSCLVPSCMKDRLVQSCMNRLVQSCMTDRLVQSCMKDRLVIQT